MISLKKVYYKINNKEILNNISFDIKDGEKVLINGKSGCGKTTIFNLIIRNIKPLSGNVYFDKKDINSFSISKLNEYRKTKLSIIMQFDDLFPYLTVLDNLTKYYFYDDCLKALKKCNLLHLKNRYVYSLSGGERQRISIIKATLANANTFLCDEITSALDAFNAKNIVDFILTNFKNKTIIFISHDYDLFKDKVDKIITIENKTISNILIINDINTKKCKVKANIEKNPLNIFLYNGLKKISIFSFLIYLIMIINIFISLNFNDIFLYFAKQSYQKYYDYDVLYIKKNIDLKTNNKDIFYSFDNIFTNSTIMINNEKYNDITFKGANSNDILAINTKLLDLLNINEASTINIINEYFVYNSNQVKIINEDNMFTIPCIYYNVTYFNKKITNYKNDELIIINYDLTNKDKRFENVSFYDDTASQHLSSNAYNDYLTYKLIFDSIKEIINSFFSFIFIYSIIVAILFNFSLINKDIKEIAIYLQNGFKRLHIISSYFIPLLIYSLIILIVSLFIRKIIASMLIVNIIYTLTLVIPFIIIIKKPLNESLKEDNYS
ncbi:MAG: ATP-binding cassette domain-containing protein [Candidatus Caccosoma sp.]|nr:ATP-binding cassette domain-containing protein [Candidatus Caccosoma sp.]